MSAIIKLKEFSSRYRLLRVRTWVLKFVDCLKHERKCKTSKLIVCDTNEAEKAWILINDVQGKLRLEKGFEQLKGMLKIVEVGDVKID